MGKGLVARAAGCVGVAPIASGGPQLAGAQMRVEQEGFGGIAAGGGAASLGMLGRLVASARWAIVSKSSGGPSSGIAQAAQLSR